MIFFIFSFGGHFVQGSITVLTSLVFVWFDSLSPINNLSFIKGWVFLGWTSTKQGLMFLLKDTRQWCRWGSNPQPLGLESSTLPLSHCVPLTTSLVQGIVENTWCGIIFNLGLLFLIWACGPRSLKIKFYFLALLVDILFKQSFKGANITI